MKSASYCISFTEMVSPAPEEVIGDAEKIREFYSTFINTIGKIAIQHKGKILKTMGDGFIFYFPQTKDPTKVAAIKNVLECSLQQMEVNCRMLVEISDLA